jgi:hypothetical protein
VPPAAQAEPQRTRSFLVTVYQNILARPIAVTTPEDRQQAQRILILGNRLARQYSLYAPELGPAAAGFVAQLSSQLLPANGVPVNAAATPQVSSGSTTKRLTKDELRDNYIDELEGAAEKESNAIFKDLAYVKAAVATRSEDYERGKRIAAKIDDNDLRRDAISFVFYRAALHFLHSGNIEKAVQLAPQVSGLRRAVLRIALAERVLTTSSQSQLAAAQNATQQSAFDLLSGIDEDLKNEAPSARVAKILLDRTAVLAKLDATQALSSLEQVVQTINKLDRFDLTDGSALDLGLAASPISGATLERPGIGFDFRSAIEPMISSHFEELASIVGRLTQKDIAGVGRIDVAKLYLQKNPGR